MRGGARICEPSRRVAGQGRAGRGRVGRGRQGGRGGLGVVLVGVSLSEAQLVGPLFMEARG